MGACDILDAIVRDIENTNLDSNNAAFLRLIADRYGLDHVAYLGLQLPGRPKSAEPFCFVTYPRAWVERYRSKNYVEIDPVVGHAQHSLLPVDWHQLSNESLAAKKLFGEANEIGIGRNGLTFSIRGRNSELALFSVASTLSNNDWRDFRREYMPSLQIVSFYLHKKVLESFGYSDLVPHLSPREEECLKWASNGKTVEDIGDIIGISAKTVKIYLDSVRHKLNCLNITHAVARATSLDLIPRVNGR